MSGIATLGGVAKATVYNHFRTKDEVWAALTDPARIARRVNEFLGFQLDEASMTAAVEPALRNQRTAPAPSPEKRTRRQTSGPKT